MASDSRVRRHFAIMGTVGRIAPVSKNTLRSSLSLKKPPHNRSSAWSWCGSLRFWSILCGVGLDSRAAQLHPLDQGH
jgi:hypothetical protein